MTRLALATLLSGALFAPSATAQQPDPSDIAARAERAVVMIEARRDGVEVSRGSGFIVSADGRIVTNRHVVEGADELQVRLASGEVYDRVDFVVDDPRRDLVVLRIPGADLPALPIGDDGDMDVGDAIYVMGSPPGLGGEVSDGLVSARRVVDGTELLRITVPISHASCGGPVLNARGEAIGVATFTVEEGENVDLAVPVRYVDGLLAMGDEPQPFSRITGQLTVADDDPSELTDDTDEPLEPWAEVLLEEADRVHALAEELGLIAVHEASFEMIDAQASHTRSMTFGPGAKVVFAVCDLDCSDIDLTVEDGEGNVVGDDYELDDRPMVEFEVPEAATYQVEVHMEDCSLEPCGVMIQSFEFATDESAGPGAGPETTRVAGPFTAADLEAFQAGFEDVSPGAWAAWVASLDGSEMAFTFQRSAQLIGAHTTDDELLEVLSWRVTSFREAARNPQRSASRACGVDALAVASQDWLSFDFGPVARILGRTFARAHQGSVPWRATTDISTDQAFWESFATYLHDQGDDDGLAWFVTVAEGGRPNDRISCLRQADLYEMVTEAPRDPVGDMSLIDVVRTLETLQEAPPDAN